MAERPTWHQDLLPGIVQRKRIKDFASVYLNEKNPHTALSGGYYDGDIIQKERLIPRKNILYCHNYENWDLGPMTIAKVKDTTGERLATLVLEESPCYDRSNRKNKRNGLMQHSVFLVSNFFSEKAKMIFSPWGMKNLTMPTERGMEKATVEEIGGKAFGQVRLKKYENVGFKVPDFFVIPTNFYKKMNAFGFEGKAEEIMSSFDSPEDIMRQNGLNIATFDLSSRAIPHAIEKLFDSLNFYESIFKPLICKKVVEFAGAKHGCILNKDLIFRSSFPLEDGDEYQFGGVFESYDYIHTTEDAYKALRHVYLSPWSSYAEFYLRNRNLIGKTSRALAVIVQEIPKDYKFVCRVFYNHGEVSVEYVNRQLFRSSDFVGRKAIIDTNNKIISRKDIVEDVFYPKQLTKMPIKEMVKIARIARRLSKKYPDYNGEFNVEALAGGENLYIVQIRPKLKLKSSSVVPEINQIDEKLVLVDFTAETNNFSIGQVEGPVVNLLGYKIGNKRYRDLDDFYAKAEHFNKLYPGAVFIVDMDFGGGTLINEKFHMLTADKVGLVTCARYDSTLRCPHFISEMYNDPCFHVVNILPEPFKDIETGKILGIVSNGDKARFYHPQDYKEPKVIFVQPEVGKKFPKSTEYKQGIIFDSSDLRSDN
jgi:hypothetical protein